MISEPIHQQFLLEALDLSEAFKVASAQAVKSPPATPPSPSPLYEAHLYDPKSSVPTSLGDLNRLWTFLDKPTDDHLGRRNESSEFNSSSSACEGSTPPSSVPEDVPDIEELIRKSKEVRWTDEISGKHIAEIRAFRRQSTRSTSPVRDRTLKAGLSEDSDFDLTPSQNTRSKRRSRNRPHVELPDPNEFESEVEPRGSKQRSSTREQALGSVSEAGDILTAATTGVFKTLLIPAWVTPERITPQHALWVPPPIPKIPLDPSIIAPLETLTRKEKYAKLVKKLQKTYAHEPYTLRLKPEKVANQYGGNNSADGLHVFVDCSNIVIGFINQLKMARGFNVKSYIKGANISWHALALVLERGRPVNRRVLVGSHGSPLHEQQMKRPEYMNEAENCGYEVNVLDRVLKAKDPTPIKKRAGTGNGYATGSGYSSGSDGQYIRRAVAEQAVDEILHMKLLESIVDTEEPSTIVLASGDAAEAEYSGGFLKNVERALARGWKVEIVAWSSGLSREYQSKAFLKKWEGQFSINILDNYSEELLALYTKSIKAPKGAQDLLASV